MFFLFLSRSMKRRWSNKKRKKNGKKKNGSSSRRRCRLLPKQPPPCVVLVFKSVFFLLMSIWKSYFFFILCNTYACSKGIFIIRSMFFFCFYFNQLARQKKKETNALYCTIIINCKYCSKNCRTTCKVSFTDDIKKRLFLRRKFLGVNGEIQILKATCCFIDGKKRLIMIHWVNNREQIFW